jgi:hypothetical protein
LEIFKIIIYVFPVRGHSYFSLTEVKKRKNADEVQNDWNELIKQARQNQSPFKPLKVDRGDLFDIFKLLAPYFLNQLRLPVKIKGI